MRVFFFACLVINHHDHLFFLGGGGLGVHTRSQILCVPYLFYIYAIYLHHNFDMSVYFSVLRVPSHESTQHFTSNATKTFRV